MGVQDDWYPFLLGLYEVCPRPSFLARSPLPRRQPACPGSFPAVGGGLGSSHRWHVRGGRCSQRRRRERGPALQLGAWSDLFTPGTTAGLLRGVRCPLEDPPTHTRGPSTAASWMWVSSAPASLSAATLGPQRAARRCTPGPATLPDEPALLTCPLGLWEE